MYYIDLILIISTAFFYAVYPFVLKKSLKNIDTIDYYCIFALIKSFPIILYIIYRIYYKKNFDTLQKLNQQDYFYLFICVLISLIAGIGLSLAVQRNNASLVCAMSDPIKLLFIILISKFIFFEKLSKSKICGCLVIFLGILILNINELKSLVE
mgnify:CR=1 FL=1